MTLGKILNIIYYTPILVYNDICSKMRIANDLCGMIRIREIRTAVEYGPMVGSKVTA